MKVLILKNISTEGPGTIGEYFAESGISSASVELGDGETPPALDGFDAVVMMGGPMGVYEMDGYPHLTAGSRLLREAINRSIKVLGVCLGAQMIAHCLGASVFKGHKEEIGWHRIELTGDGMRDPRMRCLAMHPVVGDFWKSFMVFHWHGDTFDIPIGAARLAGSKLYENQAFRYGDNVYALQFHIEVTRDMVGGWLGKDAVKGKEIERYFEELAGRARNFYKSFFEGALSVRRFAETFAK